MLIPGRRDVLIALGLVVVVAVGTGVAGAVQDRPPDVWGWALAVLAAGSLAWWRSAPLVVLAVVTMATVGYLLGGYAFGPIQLCSALATFLVARLRSMRVSLVACGVAAAGVVAALLARVPSGELPVIIAFAWANWLIVPWSLGTLVQVRTAAARRARAELVERTTLEERMRVAREVHDVAGHGFSVIAMQAGVALLVLDDSPGQARESLEAIRSTSTDALGELRTTLGMLRSFAEGTSTKGLPALAERLRSAGLPVDLQVDEAVAGALPRELDADAYRVVQESLTNVLRHAGPARAAVRVGLADGEVVVEVLDSGAGAASPGGSGGRGLSGMRARLEGVGGSLTAGPREGGGFQVLARFPLPEGGGS